MKKLLLLPFIIFLLASCLLAPYSPPTQQEIEEQTRICNMNGEKFFMNTRTYSLGCAYKQPDTSVMDCIREYTNGLDEKYNNPDTVTNLREDNYSKVVKACNEVFGKSLSGSGN